MFFGAQKNKGKQNTWITNGEKRPLDLDDAGASLCNDNDLYIQLIKYVYLDNSPIFGFPKICNNFDVFKLNQFIANWN